MLGLRTAVGLGQDERNLRRGGLCGGGVDGEGERQREHARPRRHRSGKRRGLMAGMVRERLAILSRALRLR